MILVCFVAKHLDLRAMAVTMNFENQADAEGQRGNMKVHIAGAERPACYACRLDNISQAKKTVTLSTESKVVVRNMRREIYHNPSRNSSMPLGTRAFAVNQCSEGLNTIG